MTSHIDLEATNFETLRAAVQAIRAAAKTLNPKDHNNFIGWRVSGVVRVARWLWAMPGDTWQQKWVAADGDRTWLTVAKAAAERAVEEDVLYESAYVHKYELDLWKAGVRTFIGLGLIRPSPEFALRRSNTSRLNDISDVHADDIDSVIAAGTRGSRTTDKIIYQARVALAAIIAITGKPLALITVDDWINTEQARASLLVEYRQREHKRRLAKKQALMDGLPVPAIDPTPVAISQSMLVSLHWAYSAAVAARKISPFAVAPPGLPRIPAALPTAMSQPRSYEALLDGYGDAFTGEMRRLALAVLRMGYSHKDFGTVRTDVSDVAVYLRAVRTACGPDHNSLLIPADKADEVLALVMVYEDSDGNLKQRTAYGSLLSKVRQFYEHAGTLAASSSGQEFLRLVGPFPYSRTMIREAVRQSRKASRSRLYSRIRSRLTLLDFLIPAAQAHHDAAKGLLDAALSTPPGVTFEMNGETFTRATHTLTDPAAHATAQAPVGLLVPCDTATGFRWFDAQSHYERALHAYVFMVVAVHTGFRVEEIIELEKDSLTFTDIHGSRAPALAIRSASKMDTVREVPLHREALQAIVTLIKYQTAQHGQVPLAYRRDDSENTVLAPSRYLFQIRLGSAFMACGVHNARDWVNAVIATHNATATAEHRIPAMSPHDFRRLFCTDLLERGVEIQDASWLMGHETLATTQFYNHSDKQNAHKAFRDAWKEAGELRSESRESERPNTRQANTNPTPNPDSTTADEHDPTSGSEGEVA